MVNKKEVDIIVVGAGPGGAMAAYLLAKQGFKTVLLEKERHSRKVARGEFIQPPSIELLAQQGLLEDVLEGGLQKIRFLEVRNGNRTLMSQDYEKLTRSIKYVLTGHHHVIRDLLRQKFAEFPDAELLMGTSIKELITINGQVSGVRCERDGESMDIYAKLTIAADGRGSLIRRLLAPKLTMHQEYPSDLCVIEMPKPKKGWAPVAAIHLHANPYPVAVQPLDSTTLRVAFYIPKGSFKEVREKGVGHLLQHVVSHFPDLKDSIEGIQSWEDCHLSTFNFWTEHVDQYAWDGALLMGDAAHTVSAMAGMGQQMALLDAAALVPYVKEAFIKQDLSRTAFLAYEQERMKANQEFIDFDLQSNQLNFIHKPFVVKMHHFMIKRITKIPSLMERGLELGAGYAVPEITRKQKLQAMGLLPAWI